jgi:hypothetical protein
VAWARFNRLLKKAAGLERFPVFITRMTGSWCISRSSRHGLLGWPFGHAASSRGIRARLQAAMARVKRARTRSTPRYMVCAMSPTVLVQPNGSSIFLRQVCETA